MFRTALVAATVALALVGGAFAAEISSSVDPAGLSDRERTKLGLYLSSEDAHRALEADASILLVDVRTEVEFHYVGHPVEADMNIPWKRLAIGPVFDERAGAYALTPNPDFERAIAALLSREGKSKDDPMFLICRSGGRSAAAVDFLAERGFTQVYNVVDGFEGGKDKATGWRTVEGWRKADLPWSYKVTARQAYRGPSF